MVMMAYSIIDDDERTSEVFPKKSSEFTREVASYSFYKVSVCLALTRALELLFYSLKAENRIELETMIEAGRVKG